jgi:hypothetical protein
VRGRVIPVLAVLIGVLAAGAALGPGAEASPVSCFVIHCEPTNATAAMFLDLVDLVALADECLIPLTIDFTAQWAEMILADEEKVGLLGAWIESGHEFACHHHSYWATLDRGAQWDGYTDTPFCEIAPTLQDRYRGTMDDYMALLTALPGERTSACMGLEDEADLIDWPEALRYGTSGHTVEDCVSEPFVVDYAGTRTWQITHGLILQGPGALEGLHEATSEDVVFAVVGHVYNFAEDRRPFEFRFLRALDPAGTRRRTVTEAIEERLVDGG